jgi:hypothetical protein
MHKAVRYVNIGIAEDKGKTSKGSLVHQDNIATDTKLKCSVN